jgi:DNA-binding MarR family transcriptional regulator
MSREESNAAPSSPAPNTATLLSLAHLLVSRQVSDAVSQAGFSVKASHGAVFSQLGPEGARLTDLARVAQMSPQAMGEVVDELESLGYVERSPDQTDRRAKLITLTDEGRRCSDAGGDAIRALEEQIDTILGEGGHHQLRRMLTQLLEHGLESR